MAFRASIYTVAPLARRPLIARSFHSTRRALIKVGDALPGVELFEKSAASKVNLVDEFTTKNGYIIGVPGAFTGTCSSQHIPSFINHPKLKEAGQVFVVSVNDPFVMKAWADQLDPAEETGIRFLADPTAEFSKALELSFDDAAPLLGGTRSKRYALKIDNGKVTKTFIEPDSTGADVSMAAKVFA